MQKYVKVVFDVYELDLLTSNVTKKQKWERVPFCEQNTEYDDSADYEENVRNFISECLNSQVVFLGDKYIPIHNIHGFYFDKENKQDIPPVKEEKYHFTEGRTVQATNNSNNRNQNNNNRRHGRFKKIKHGHGRPRSNATASLPFKVENNGQTLTGAPITPIITSTPQLPEFEAK